MWKDKEEYIFDMPGSRISDVYEKNSRVPLWPYLKAHNPKITGMRFHETMPGLYVEVGHPKYPKDYPYFTNEDQATLLETYMNYANATIEDMQAWYKLKNEKGEI